MPQPTVHLRFLGQYAVEIGGHLLPPFPTEKSRSLFAYLALHPGAQSRAWLAGLFWPDLPEKRARRRLTQELWRLGSGLKAGGAADLLQTTGPTVGFHPQHPLVCDALALDEALNRLRGEPPHAWPSADQLLALYPGELLPGLYDEWVLVERERLFQRLLDGLARLLARAKEQAAWEEALALLERLTGLDPLNEQWVEEALRVTMALGRAEKGLALYARLEERLQTELDAAPSPGLAERVRQISLLPEPGPAPGLSFADPAYQPPLLGREAERGLLLQALDELQRGRGQLIFLEGEPGVGKSRLLETFVDDARWRGLLVGVGRGLETREHEAYLPLLQALDGLLTPLRSQQLRLLLDPLWLSLAARRLPRLAEWLPDLPALPPLEPEPERIRTLEALTRLFLALAELSPTLLLLDDLQWADNATLDLLIYLTRRISGARLLLLLSFRQAEARTDLRVWLALQEMDRGEPARRLELTGLAPEASGALVRALLQLDRPAPRFEGQIYARTQGNPFFILETLRALHQEGSLIRDEEGGWRTPWDAVTADYREAAIPAQVEEVIRRRLAQLRPEERPVLELAAVLATPFDLTQLTHFLPDGGRQVLAAVAGLVQRRFLQEMPTAYRFEHDQIRQTVYARMDPTLRRQLHRRVGEGMAQHQPDAYAQLAYHFEQAGAVGRAFGYAWKAGQAAQQAGAYRLARDFYARSAGWLPGLPLSSINRFDFLMEWERLLGLLGEREAQQEVLDQLVHLPELDARRRGAVLLRQALAHRDAGRLEEARTHVAESLALALAEGDLGLEAECLTAWGLLLHWQGDEAGAQAKLEAAATAAVGSGDLRLQAVAWNRLADLLPARNAYAAAVEAGEKALAAFQSLGDVAGAAEAQLSLAVAAMERGDVQAAVAGYDATLALAQECGHRVLEARVCSNRANGLCVLGRIGEALASYAQGVEIARSLGDERLYSLIVLNYASTHFSFVGREEGLRQGVERALAWAQTAGDDLSVGQAWNLLSLDAAYGGDLAQARAYLERSAAAFARVDYAYIQAQALRAQAQLCQMEGRWEEALARIRQALAAGAQIGAHHFRAEMGALEAEILLALGQVDAALAAAEGAAAHATADVFQSYLLHHRCSRVWRAAGQTDKAQAALSQAWTEYNALLASLSPAQQAQSRQEIPDHRALLADAARFLTIAIER